MKKTNPYNSSEWGTPLLKWKSLSRNEISELLKENGLQDNKLNIDNKIKSNNKDFN